MIREVQLVASQPRAPASGESAFRRSVSVDKSKEGERAKNVQDHIRGSHWSWLHCTVHEEENPRVL